MCLDRRIWPISPCLWMYRVGNNRSCLIFFTALAALFGLPFFHLSNVILLPSLECKMYSFPDHVSIIKPFFRAPFCPKIPLCRIFTIVADGYRRNCPRLVRMIYCVDSISPMLVSDEGMFVCQSFSITPVLVPQTFLDPVVCSFPGCLMIHVG